MTPPSLTYRWRLFAILGAVLMAMVAFAARYTHTPFETGHLGDIETLTQWLCSFVREDFANSEL